MKNIRVQDILDSLPGKSAVVLGDAERIVTHPVSLGAPDGLNAVSFCKSSYPDAISQMQKSCVSTVFCRNMEKLETLLAEGKTIIVVDNPRLSFIKTVQTFFSEPFPQGIHSTAVVDPSAVVDPTAYVGPMAYIGPSSSIGSGSVIHGRVYVYGNAKIGRNVIIHAGAVIGADGFGFERNDEGKFDKFPHRGGVEIGDDVEIGANTCIDRGTLGNTIIKDRTKIDNLVHIAHNVVIEEDCAVIAHAMVAGSVKIGKGAWIAPCASIRESIKVGSKSLVGLGAVVVSEVREGTTVMGAPAREISEYKVLLNAQKALLGK